MTIGYDRDVILPLAVVPEDPAKPVTLRLKADYAICEKALRTGRRQGRTRRSFRARPSSSAQLAAAEAPVPKPQAVGQGTGLAIRSVRRDSAAQHKPKPRVVVDVAAPPGTEVDLFAEGPTAEWALPVPQPRRRRARRDQQRFAFDLDGAPPGAEYHGSRLTLTAVAGHDAIEVTIRLD